MQARYPTTVATLLMVAMALHASPPAELPTAVADDVALNAALCADAGGKALTDEAVKRADLNGDGEDDYVVNVGSMQCVDAVSIYGDRDKLVTVFAGEGNGGGAVAAFSATAYGIRLEGTGASARIWLTVMGEQCGRKPAADFAGEHFCERALVWNAATRKFDFAPVSTVRVIG